MINKFIDICSGIGSGRLALEQLGLFCVAHCEIDDQADKTYQCLFDDHYNLGDVTKLPAEEVPDFDLLIAGFPCQPFSIAGKRNGLNDNRSNVIQSICYLLERKQPACFLLENVKGLVNHDKGRTLKTILSELEMRNYTVFLKVLDSKNYNVPQMRERVYLVGFRKDLSINTFIFPSSKSGTKPLRDFLEPSHLFELDPKNKTFTNYLNNKYNKGSHDIHLLMEKDYTVIDWRQSDLRVYNQIVPTLRTGRHGILYVYNQKLYKLNGYEAFSLQGFDSNHINKLKQSGVSQTRLLSQAGNAMTVNVINAIGREMLVALKER